ncbi:hypothetical protein J2Z69_001372 [Paenibacillus shirakamiensis]|uniref:Uncharacterized protein n=1 Tax=Paenibacillus shirakamiensis TaxID=1265935 RepID=A0ABS4JF80_9BACL|nr:hypothetical protein [Paenibacillus shirakamiensis]MBP2000353.1 hypothetical protein [Paenibacillus shirakamiensis]
MSVGPTSHAQSNNAPQTSTSSEPQVISAGRSGLRLGQISELTIIAPLKPGGADRLREKLRQSAAHQQERMAKIATVHDMRFVIFDQDTRLLFATAYDGDWDTYIDDFGTQIPDLLNYFFEDVEEFPGIETPGAKDFIAKHQVTASGWYAAYPSQTVRDIWRGQRVVQAFNELIDAAQS